MAYLALYRKYRPTTFDSLIGQDHIVKTLTNQIESGRLGHAYLFTGTRGTGKTSAAKIFAKAINCQSPINGSPCGKCDCCVALSDPSNIDVVEIDAASNNGVNEIRDLREMVQYPPVSCKYKVYIIDEVHMLTGAAFNALLKTLEEPPKHAVFILATTEVHKIPATILSRCMRFDFRLISNEMIAKLISDIYDEQGKKYEPEAVFAIAKAGEGSIRDALSIADTAISYNSGVLTYDDVTEILGSSSWELIFGFLSSIVNGNTGEVLAMIDKLSGLGKSMGVLIKDVTSAVRDLLVVKTCADANKILGLPQEKFIQLEKIAKSTNEERLLRVLEVFSDAEMSLKYTNHPRVFFETASIKATRPESDYDLDALMARIKTLEDKLKNGVTTVVQEVPKIVEKDPEKVKKVEKLNIADISINDLKGKLFFNLRQAGSEMLWNILQATEISVKGNVLLFNTTKTGDLELLERPETEVKVKDALKEFNTFELKVQLDEKEKSMKEVDVATERIKKIFGDDIVIIKN